jgi:ribosomal protein L37AE/L43A
MSSRDAARLMFVAMGIFSLMGAIALVQGAFFMLGMGEDSISRVISGVAAILPILCYLWLAAHLIRHRERYSEHLFPTVKATTGAISTDDLHTVGISLIGVYVIVAAAPKIFRHLAVAIISLIQRASSKSVVTGQLGDPSSLYPQMTEEVVASLCQLALGIVLVWIPARITAFLLRRKAQAAAPDPERLACPSCGHPYSLSDYREDVKVPVCSKCKAQLPDAASRAQPHFEVSS